MKCDVCGKPATIEEVTKVGDSYTYKHMCEACAADAGVIGYQPPPPVDSGKAAKAIVQIAKARSTPIMSCESCGLTLDEFREHGRLGCTRCYTSFERQLGPLIARAHEGGTHHVGKVPKRLLESATSTAKTDESTTTDAPGSRDAIERLLGKAQQRDAKLQTLKRQLAESLRAERYEQAAMIRDEISKLQSPQTLQSDPEGGPQP